jgi:uncharacterized protein
MKLTIAHEEIQLLSEKAFFWPKEKLIGLSDIHIGKAESLQKMGIPVPSGAHLNDLLRLQSLIVKTNAEKVFILGDFIHQKSSWTANIISDLHGFFNRWPLIEWNLLVGNHDKTSLNHFREFPIKLHVNDIQMEPFIFTHGHKKSDQRGNLFSIEGHIHPVIKLQEGSTSLRLPCFILNSSSLTIPSFGELTGGYEITPKKDERIFAVAGNEIFEI